MLMSHASIRDPAGGARTARRHGGPRVERACGDWSHGAAEELTLAGGYTCLANVLGYPAGVVPVTRVRRGEETGGRPTADRMDRAAHEIEVGGAGLPVGVQVIARPWREHVGLAAMAALEQRPQVAREAAGFPPF